jgi:transcriptional regulator with XRE-family HTH domain
MKRKNLKQPDNITIWGKWLYDQLFEHNITIKELADDIHVRSCTVYSWMRDRQNRVPAYRIVDICAVLADSEEEYRGLIIEANQHLVNYQFAYRHKKGLK